MKGPPRPFARIAGLGVAVPERVVPNSWFEERLDTSDQWIVDRTGIRERHFAGPADTVASLSATAAAGALERAGLTPAQLDAIVLGTATPDRLLPATACDLQALIGATNAFALDIDAACPGFLFALSMAEGLIAAGQGDNILVLGAEKLTAITDFEDRGTAVLFGDGAGAVVLTRTVPDGPAPRGILSSFLKSDGRLADLLYRPGGGSLQPISHEVVTERSQFMKMQGREVFKAAVRAMAEACDEALQRAGVTGDDIDLLVPHQANLRIIDATARHAGVPMNKVMVNVEKYGNTSSASIPLALAQAGSRAAYTPRFAGAAGGVWRRLHLGEFGRPVVTVVICPGQGSQKVGMGRELADAFPAAREVFERVDDALDAHLTRVMWDGPEEELTLTHNAQPAILAHSIAALAAAGELVGTVALAAGHSLGEYSAYVAARSLSIEDAARLVRRRGELMFQAGQARPGAMAAVLGLATAEVASACAESSDGAGVAVAANQNAPDQTVISGDPEAVERASARCRDAGAKRVIPLKVSGAFHSPLMEPAVAGLAAALGETDFKEPAFPVVANATATPVRTAAEARQRLVEQLTAPVRWVASVETLAHEAPGARFIEAGPGAVLSGLVRRIIPGCETLTLGTPDDVSRLSAPTEGS